MSFQWTRRGRLRTRPATPADGAALCALPEAPDSTRLDVHSPAGPAAGPRRHVIAEIDGQIAAALTARRADRRAPRPLHPWTELDDAPLESAPDGNLLRVTGLVSGSSAPAARPARLLDAPLKTYLQRRSLTGAVAEIRLRPHSPDGPTLPPSAHLQQVVYRTLEDPALTPWLKAGFFLDGWYRRDSSPVALVCWENVRGA